MALLTPGHGPDTPYRTASRPATPCCTCFNWCCVRCAQEGHGSHSLCRQNRAPRPVPPLPPHLSSFTSTPTPHETPPPPQKKPHKHTKNTHKKTNKNNNKKTTTTKHTHTATKTNKQTNKNNNRRMRVGLILCVTAVTEWSSSNMLTFALRNKPETCAREEKQTMMEIAWWSDGGYASTQIAPMQCTGPFLPVPPSTPTPATPPRLLV